MRLGVFVGDFEPHVGGGYTFVTEVVESLLELEAESKHPITLFCSPAYAESLRGRALKQVEVVPISKRGPFELAAAALRHYLPAFGYLFRGPCRLERVARKKGVELMWFAGGFYDTLDLPYVATVWDLQHLTHPWFPEVSADWQWDKRELFFSRHLRRATRVITGTEAGRKELETFYRLPSDRLRKLPHPTPGFCLRAATQPAADVRAKYKLGAEYLVYPAQFWAHKNHVNLLLGLKALKERRGKIPDLALVGSDKGNRAFVQRRAAELGLGEQVRFLGFVPAEDLVALYRGARALAYPSFSGPENLPPLEAFALGCPVAASDFPGAREQFGDAVEFFDPHDPASIAKALEAVLTDDALRGRLIEKGRARAARWTGKDYVRGVLSMVDEFESERRCW